MPNTEPLTNQRKIRKGTRSCWECKRRKIKCIFPVSGEATCVCCQRRRVPCVGQEMPESLAVPRNINRRLGDRMARVEEVMKDLLASQTEEKSLQNRKNPNSRTIKAYPSDPISSPIRLLPAAAEALEAQSPRSEHHVSNLLPIVDLAEAEVIASHSLWAAFPAKEDVEILLEESLRTSRYTLLVNTQPHGKLTLESLGAPYLATKCPNHNAPPIILAKCMLIFAITLQSPREEFVGLSEPANLLSRRMVTAAVMWLKTQEEMESSLESLICIILEANYETNSGNLRKAWAVYRRAMTIAQIMGLHRSPIPPLKRTEPTLDADPEYMWFRIVFMDRYLSLLLGLPQGTTDKSIGAFLDLRNEPPLGHFERQLTVVASRILERDEVAFNISEIATTQSIDAELLRLSKEMPVSFWRPANFQNVKAGSPENLLETIRLAAHVYYYGLLIQLHLPYMMHGISNNTDHEYSKLTCVNAGREIITRFIAHRSFQLKSSCSRPVDFFAFLAAMTLLLAHLDAQYHQKTTNFLAHQRLSDRALLNQALEIMDTIRDSNSDNVMEESSKLMKQLLEIEANTADGANYTTSCVRRDEGHEQGSAEKACAALHLLIPYLGTIKITHQGSISREPLQRKLASQPYQTSQTDSPYVKSSRAMLNDVFPSVPHITPTDTWQPLHLLHCTAQDASFSGDLLNSVQSNSEPQTSSQEQQCELQYRSGLGEEESATESYLDLPDDWAFQGVDIAFFDSLMRGCSSLDQ